MKNLLLILSLSLSMYPAIAEQKIQYDIRIDGFTCPFCIATSEKALKKIEGIELISSNLETGTISVCGASTLVLEELELERLFLKKGFTYRGLTKIDGCSLSTNGKRPSANQEQPKGHSGHGEQHTHE